MVIPICKNYAPLCSLSHRVHNLFGSFLYSNVFIRYKFTIGQNILFIYMKTLGVFIILSYRIKILSTHKNILTAKNVSAWIGVHTVATLPVVVDWP